MNEATATDAPALPQELEERRLDKVQRWALEGAKLMGVATHRVTTRTLWWGGWGLVLGTVTFVLEWWLGWLVFPWPEAQLWITLLVGLLYPIAGAGAWGHAGMWRGAGRFVLFVGIDKGWVLQLCTVLLERIMGLLRKSTRVDRMLDASEAWVGDLPLEQWEDLLKRASAAVIGENTQQSNRLMRWIRKLVVQQIEKIMLRIVRKETQGGTGGGVSMARVREVLFEKAEEAFEDAITGLMNKQLMLMTAGFIGVAALPPLLAALAWWWMA